VHQVKGHEERITAIAREYAKSPNGTLVVSPDNRSRSEINQRIHDELQSRGLVNRQEHSVRTLVPRQEMTGADRSWAQQYKVDDILRYSRISKETGIERGEYSRVVAVNAQANTLTVVRGNGKQTTYDPRRQVGVSVYREDEKRFSVGDRIQFTAPNQELKVANRDLGTVEGIGRDGAMRLRLDDERQVDFNPRQHPHLDHGYAVTSFSSQGQTAERVLVQAIQYSDLNYSPREGEVRTYLTDWANYRYTISRDTIAKKYPLNYYFLSGNLSSQLMTDDNANHLVSQVIGGQIEQSDVEVKNVTITSMSQEIVQGVTMARGTALVAIDKLYSPRNSHEPRVEHWGISVTYYLNPKQVSDQARIFPQFETINPLGLTITEFHENRLSVDPIAPGATAASTDGAVR
jgi:type IV secretion system protein VirB5